MGAVAGSICYLTMRDTSPPTAEPLCQVRVWAHSYLPKCARGTPAADLGPRCPGNATAMSGLTGLESSGRSLIPARPRSRGPAAPLARRQSEGCGLVAPSPIPALWPTEPGEPAVPDHRRPPAPRRDLCPLPRLPSGLSRSVWSPATLGCSWWSPQHSERTAKKRPPPPPGPAGSRRRGAERRAPPPVSPSVLRGQVAGRAPGRQSRRIRFPGSLPGWR
jgi:hypothetical protein